MNSIGKRPRPSVPRRRGEATPTKTNWALAQWNGKPSRTNRAEERRGLRRAYARCPREGALRKAPQPTSPNPRRTAGSGDRGFESRSLQQTVRLSPASTFEGRQPRLSARVCAAGLATGSAETRRVFRYRANRRQYLCRAIFQYRSAADGVGENATPGPNELGAPGLT